MNTLKKIIYSFLIIGTMTFYDVHAVYQECKNRIDTLKNLVLEAQPTAIIEHSEKLPADIIQYALSSQSPWEREHKRDLCVHQLEIENRYDAQQHHSEYGKAREARKKFFKDRYIFYSMDSEKRVDSVGAANDDTIKKFIEYGYPIHYLLLKNIEGNKGNRGYSKNIRIIDNNNFSLQSSKKRLNQALIALDFTLQSMFEQWNSTVDYIDRLLQAGAYIHTRNNNGFSFFYQTCYNLRIKCDINEKHYNQGAALLDKLLHYGADINDPCSPNLLCQLHYQAFGTVRYLLSRGAKIFKPHAQLCLGGIKIKTIPLVDIFDNYPPARIEKDGNNWFAINQSRGECWRASKKLYIEHIASLPNAMKKLQKKYEQGQTILHILLRLWERYTPVPSTYHDERDILATLLEKGALLTAHDDEGFSVAYLLFQWAVRKKILPEVKAIVDKHASPECQELFGQYVKEYAMALIE